MESIGNTVRKYICTIFLVFLSSILLNTIDVYAAETTINGVTYKTSNSNKTLTITGSGKITKGWQTDSNLKDYVTKIERVDFYSNTITACDSDAFQGCTSIKTVNIRYYNNGFYNTTAFKNCTTLTTLGISNQIVSICDEAFMGCTNLVKIRAGYRDYYCNTCSSYLTSKTDGHAQTCTTKTTASDLRYKFSSSLTTVGNYAFYNCTSLVKLNTRQVTTLGEYTFKGTTPLTTLTIGDDIPNHNNAFKGHTGIQTMEVTSGVTTIYDSMFEGCTGLTYINLHQSSLRTIGEKAFMGCSGLCVNGPYDESSDGGAVNFPHYATSVGKYAFRFYGNSSETAQLPVATVSQSAAWIDTTNGIAEVTMNVSATTPSTSANSAKDYLIIMDVSGSMSDKVTLSDGTQKTQMDIAKDSLNAFLDKMVEEGSNNRVCIVALGKIRSTVFMHWRTVNSSNLTATKQYINDNMNYDTGENGKAQTNSWGESASGNTKRMWLNNSIMEYNLSNYSGAIKLALRALQSKGTTTDTYAVVIGDFECMDGASLDSDGNKVDSSTDTKNRIITAYGQILCGAVEDVWSIEVASKSDNAPDFAKLICTDDTANYTEIPDGADFDTLLKSALTNVVDASLICAKDATLSETLNTTYWEVYDTNGLTNTNGVLSKSGLVLDRNTQTYKYKIKLKDAYKDTAGNYLVSNNIKVDYSIYTGVDKGEAGTKTNSTAHYLQWTPPVYTLTINPNNGSLIYKSDGSVTKTSFDVKFKYGTNRFLGIFESTFQAYKTSDTGKSTPIVSLPIRTGYTFKEWKVTSGGGTVNYYSTPTDNPRGYKTDNFNAAVERPSTFAYYLYDGNYRGNVTITAQWTPNVYKITLNNQSATTAGTTAYYEKYDTGNYTATDCRTIISKITIPAKTGYTFGGYYTATNGSGTQYIDASGNIKSTSTTFTSDTTLYAKWTANTYYVQYNKGFTNGGGTTATTTHTYDADVTLASNGFTGRGYLVSFNGNKPNGTIGTVQNLPSTKAGNLSFKNWYVDATYNDGYYTANTNLGKKNFESTQGATAKATAQWNNASVVWTEKPTLVGYDFKYWTYSDGTKVNTNGSNTLLIVTPSTSQYEQIIYAAWTPRNDTKYTVNHWVQNITATSDEHNPQNFTLIDTEVLQGTSDTYVTPAVKQYEGCISPQSIRIKINADGSTVVNYYYTRIKLSLDIDGEYLKQHFPDTNGLATFDVYINNKLVADDVYEYFNDKIPCGSTWKVADINPDSGRHYSGSDIKTEQQILAN